MSVAHLTAQPDWAYWQRGSLIAAAVGAVLCTALSLLLGPVHFFRAYLVAFNFWLAIPLGCLLLLMLQYLTGGAWGLLLRRIVEAAVSTLPLLGLAFLPLLLGLPWIYIWAPEAVAHSPELQHKAPYLNVPFFVTRAFIFFAIWQTLVFFLKRWSPVQPAPDALARQRSLRRLSAGGLVLYGLTVTFAAIDWGMSVEPLWYSTMYPVLYGVSQGLSALAFALVVLSVLGKSPPLAGLLQPDRLRDLGNLLLMFVMLWAYLSISQFLLIWAANLPEEIPWYLRRLRGGWEWVALLLLLFQFALPFVLLLLRQVKQDMSTLGKVAGLVLVMRFVDVVWWIEAAYVDGALWYGLLDLAAVVGLGGLWLWVFLWHLQRQPQLPIHDPYWPEYFPEKCHE